MRWSTTPNARPTASTPRARTPGRASQQTAAATSFSGGYRLSPLTLGVRLHGAVNASGGKHAKGARVPPEKFKSGSGKTNSFAEASSGDAVGVSPGSSSQRFCARLFRALSDGFRTVWRGRLVNGPHI